MKRYWFYGTMPDKTIPENNLTEEQKRIIENENGKLSQENFADSWLGYKNGNGWDFMRHGFEVHYIDEEKSNVARQIFVKTILKKIETENSFSK